MGRVLKFVFKELLNCDTEKKSEPDTKMDDNYGSVRMKAKNCKLL